MRKPLAFRSTRSTLLLKRNSDRVDPVILDCIADALGIPLVSLKNGHSHSIPYNIMRKGKEFYQPHDLAEDVAKAFQYYNYNPYGVLSFFGGRHPPQKSNPEEVIRLKELFSFLAGSKEYTFEDQMRIMFEVMRMMDKICDEKGVNPAGGEPY